jgi:multiple sugar transport system ATP-binding protein
MLSGVLQQVGSPMELYDNPTNLFVAGFIGSPGMNFIPAKLNNGGVRLPMVDVPLPRELRDRVASESKGKLIVGIRPEDFEDAARVDGDSRGRGTTFRAKLDLVEAMGAEFYAHFAIDAPLPQSDELAELRDELDNLEETSEAGGVVLVARLSPQSRARTGQESELWLDGTKLHFFDAESGDALANGH